MEPSTPSAARRPRLAAAHPPSYQPFVAAISLHEAAGIPGASAARSLCCRPACLRSLRDPRSLLPGSGSFPPVVNGRGAGASPRSNCVGNGGSDKGAVCSCTTNAVQVPSQHVVRSALSHSRAHFPLLGDRRLMAQQPPTANGVMSPVKDSNEVRRGVGVLPAAVDLASAAAASTSCFGTCCIASGPSWQSSVPGELRDAGRASNGDQAAPGAEREDRKEFKARECSSSVTKPPGSVCHQGAREAAARGCFRDSTVSAGAVWDQSKAPEGDGVASECGSHFPAASTVDVFLSRTGVLEEERRDCSPNHASAALDAGPSKLVREVGPLAEAFASVSGRRADSEGLDCRLKDEEDDTQSFLSTSCGCSCSLTGNCTVCSCGSRSDPECSSVGGGSSLRVAVANAASSSAGSVFGSEPGITSRSLRAGCSPDCSCGFCFSRAAVAMEVERADARPPFGVGGAVVLARKGVRRDGITVCGARVADGSMTPVGGRKRLLEEYDGCFDEQGGGRCSVGDRSGQGAEGEKLPASPPGDSVFQTQRNMVTNLFALRSSRGHSVLAELPADALSTSGSHDAAVPAEPVARLGGASFSCTASGVMTPCVDGETAVGVRRPSDGPGITGQRERPSLLLPIPSRKARYSSPSESHNVEKRASQLEECNLTGCVGRRPKEFSEFSPLSVEVCHPQKDKSASAPAELVPWIAPPKDVLSLARNGTEAREMKRACVLPSENAHSQDVEASAVQSLSSVVQEPWESGTPCPPKPVGTLSCVHDTELPGGGWLPASTPVAVAGREEKREERQETSGLLGDDALCDPTRRECLHPVVFREVPVSRSEAIRDVSVQSEVPFQLTSSAAGDGVRTPVEKRALLLPGILSRTARSNSGCCIVRANGMGTRGREAEYPVVSMAVSESSEEESCAASAGLKPCRMRTGIPCQRAASPFASQSAFRHTPPSRACSTSSDSSRCSSGCSSCSSVLRASSKSTSERSSSSVSTRRRRRRLGTGQCNSSSKSKPGRRSRRRGVKFSKSLCQVFIYEAFPWSQPTNTSGSGADGSASETMMEGAESRASVSREADRERTSAGRTLTSGGAKAECLIDRSVPDMEGSVFRRDAVNVAASGVAGALDGVETFVRLGGGNGETETEAKGSWDVDHRLRSGKSADIQPCVSMTTAAAERALASIVASVDMAVPVNGEASVNVIITVHEEAAGGRKSPGRGSACNAVEISDGGAAAPPLATGLGMNEAM
ncbi:hypothetical protein CSUI_003405 [Cystoisospora suis]|uniref:Uncharacterized protein n=1 Tax=Cystoisospora suis TaxID=483139 RepID=A0A2C6L0Y1_9APIC|nr:hypothetical protein CSUI_003405 [Cystoisospora suis]